MLKHMLGLPLSNHNHYFAVPFSVTRGAEMTHFSIKCVGFLWQFSRSLLLGHSPPKNKKGHEVQNESCPLQSSVFSAVKSHTIWMIDLLSTPSTSMEIKAKYHVSYLCSEMQLNPKCICLILHGHFGQ